MTPNPVCTACGTMLPLDVQTRFDGECPRKTCSRVNRPEEVLL